MKKIILDNNAYTRLLAGDENVLDASLETAEVFGSIKNTLRHAGTPLPINDVWIATHDVETGSTIVTYDTHFKQVPGLRLWDQL